MPQRAGEARLAFCVLNLMAHLVQTAVYYESTTPYFTRIRPRVLFSSSPWEDRRPAGVTQR